MLYYIGSFYFFNTTLPPSPMFPYKYLQLQFIEKVTEFLFSSATPYKSQVLDSLSHIVFSVFLTSLS